MEAMDDCRIRLAFALLTVAALVPGPARAQSPDPPPAPPAREVTWRATAGYDWFALHDTAQGIDASPMAWTGSGARLLVQHTRALPMRFHRYELQAAFPRGFEYTSSVDSVPASSRDAIREIEGRYEYRRFVFDDVGWDGLDVGLGVQALGGYGVARRAVPDAIEARESAATIGTAVTTSVRVRRWSRVKVEAAWINGIEIARLSEHHSVDPAAARARSGGGWLTDLMLSADVAMSRRMSLAVTYARVGDARLSSHRGFTTDRQWFTFGVAYAK